MKSNLILLTAFLLFTTIGRSQDFSTKPYTLANHWIQKGLTIGEIKKNIPEGYKIAHEETDKLVFEKEVNSKVYEIKVFFKDSKVTGVMFTQHIERVWKLISEIKDDLKFKMINNLTFNGIETNIYENQAKNLNASLIINEGMRIITCYFNKK